VDVTVGVDDGVGVGVAIHAFAPGHENTGAPLRSVEEEHL